MWAVCIGGEWALWGKGGFVGAAAVKFDSGELDKSTCVAGV